MDNPPPGHRRVVHPRLAVDPPAEHRALAGGRAPPVRALDYLEAGVLGPFF
jgi:hypothetical protein